LNEALAFNTQTQLKTYKDYIPMGPSVNNTNTPYYRHTKFLNGKLQVVLYFSSTYATTSYSQVAHNLMKLSSVKHTD